MTQLTPQIVALAQIVWDYMRLGQPVEPADCLVACGSNDLGVAERAADLMLADFAFNTICTGGIAHLDDLLATGWELSEAEMFQKVLIKKGVLAEKIFLENQALHTGENVRLSLKIAREKSIPFNRVLFVCKPYMERRVMVTAGIAWRNENIKYAVTSQLGGFIDYFSNETEAIKHLNLMIGDLHRIVFYPALGLQLPQEIPDDVVYAFNSLVELGFDKHLLKNKTPLLIM